jgi:hypothetical protein
VRVVKKLGQHEARDRAELAQQRDQHTALKRKYELAKVGGEGRGGGGLTASACRCCERAGARLPGLLPPVIAVMQRWRQAPSCGRWCSAGADRHAPSPLPSSPPGPGRWPARSSSRRWRCWPQRTATSRPW